jgi:tRNA(Arg) A34 adenosine deaminase TadA
MCLAACYWAQIPRIICAATSSDATAAGFPDKAILDELCRTASSRLIQITQLLPADGRRLFEEWTAFQAGARDAIGGTTD